MIYVLYHTDYYDIKQVVYKFDNQQEASDFLLQKYNISRDDTGMFGFSVDSDIDNLKQIKSNINKTYLLYINLDRFMDKNQSKFGEHPNVVKWLLREEIIDDVLK